MKLGMAERALDNCSVICKSYQQSSCVTDQQTDDTYIERCLYVIFHVMDKLDLA